MEETANGDHLQESLQKQSDARPLEESALTPRLQANLERLLATAVVANVQLAFEMMKPHGVPAPLHAAVLAIVVAHRDEALRREAHALLAGSRLPAEWTTVAELEYVGLLPDNARFPYLRGLMTWEGIDVSGFAKMVVACDRRYEPIWYVHQTVEDMMGDNFKNGWLRLDQLIDPVLPETVFQLPGLEELLISHLRYKTLPKGVEKLPGLKRLTMRFNRMSKLSSRFAKLSSLENLGLAHNNFKTVPAVLGKLPHLKVLELASNPLGDWTSAPGDFRALRALWIYDCGFSAFPKDLLHLDLLEELHIGRISDTKRFTSIPAEIAEMKGLRHLDVSAQLIEALPNTMATMALEKLNLSYTQLQVFPSAQLNAATLQSINISNCKKIHRLPDYIGDFIHLQHLNIGGTSIRTLPATIAQLQNLQMLDISGLQWEDASGTLEILFQLPALKELTCYRQPQSFIDALRRQLQFTLVRD